MYLNLPRHFISDSSHCQLYCWPIALISDRPHLLSPCRAVVQGRKGECCYFSEIWLWLSFCKIAQCSYAVASLCSPLNSHSPYPAAHCLSPSEHSVSVFNHLLHIWSIQEYLGLIFNAKHSFPGSLSLVIPWCNFFITISLLLCCEPFLCQWKNHSNYRASLYGLFFRTVWLFLILVFKLGCGVGINKWVELYFLSVFSCILHKDALLTPESISHFSYSLPLFDFY